jgi:hypothetical protein
MKRPRFGLKLIFLITALVAGLMAWRHTVDQNERAANEEKAKPIRVRLAKAEARREEILQWLKDNKLPVTATPALGVEDDEIEYLEWKIDELTR